MPTIEIDLTNAPDEIKFELPGPGLRRVECTQATVDYNSKNTGQNIVLQLKVSDPNHPTDEGRSLRDWLALPNQGDDQQSRANKMAKAKMACKAFGVTYGASFNTEDFIGKVAQVDITHTPGKPDPANPTAVAKMFANVGKYIVPA